MTEQTYDRLSLAKEQLETALDLFLDQKKYSCAITLAGAAETVFGNAIGRKGGSSALEDSYRTIAEFHHLMHGTVLDKQTYIAEENQARDALKHLQENKGPTVTLDLEEAACWMLVRALQNARTLSMDFERSRDFDNWFYENIVGV